MLCELLTTTTCNKLVACAFRKLYNLVEIAGNMHGTGLYGVSWCTYMQSRLEAPCVLLEIITIF